MLLRRRFALREVGKARFMADPVETVKDLAAEADRGRSPRTPVIALTGITLFLGVAFAIFVTIALVLYFAYGGK
jgi:hypothetical protein